MLKKIKHLASQKEMREIVNHPHLSRAVRKKFKYLEIILKVSYRFEMKTGFFLLSLIISTSIFAQKMSETYIETIDLYTQESYELEQDALKAAFEYEDRINSRKVNLTKYCWNYLRIVPPTVVRLETDKLTKKIRGKIEVKIRCVR